MTIPYEFIKKYVDPENPDQFNNVEIDYDNEKIRTDRRLFNIRTYDGFRKGVAGWANIEPANRFITQNFDLDEYDYLVRLFVRSKRELINATTGDAIVSAVEIIDGYVYKCFKKLGMSARIFDFVCRDKNISLPDFANKEMRPQDTEEKTFYEDDYHLINTIIIISKILSPLFGEIINRIKISNDSYKSMKEIVAFGIINTILREDFEAITKKLQNYIAKMIERFLSDDTMITFNGITATGLTHYQFAKIIVKNFANHNLYVPDGNVIRAVCVTLKRSIENETKGSTRQVTYFERMSPESSDDDQNMSFFENSVNSVNEPVETPVLVSLAINQFIDQYLIDNSIDVKVFNDIVKYYEITIVQPTPVNELLVAMFIADPIGAAYSVKYMDMTMIIKVIAIIQIYAMMMGFNEIVPLLSLSLTNIAKVETNDIDNRIILNNGRCSNPNSTNYFINLTESVSHIHDWNGFDFHTYMKVIMMFIVENVHMYNVAPGILSFGNTGSSKAAENGVLIYDENIIYELHRFMYNLLLPTNPERRLT